MTKTNTNFTDGVGLLFIYFQLQPFYPVIIFQLYSVCLLFYKHVYDVYVLFNKNSD